MFPFLQNDGFLKFASLILLPVALAVKGFTPDHTIANKLSDYVVGIGAALGIFSSTGREKKVE